MPISRLWLARLVPLTAAASATRPPGPSRSPRAASGPAPVPRPTEVPVGHVRRGAGFTVWEPTRREAEAWAAELAACAPRRTLDPA